MKRFLAAHLNLIAAAAFFAVGTWLSLHLSAQADRRQQTEIAFQREWKESEQVWIDSDRVQAARNDSFLKAVIDSLRVMHLRAVAQRERLEAQHH